MKHVKSHQNLVPVKADFRQYLVRSLFHYVTKDFRIRIDNYSALKTSDELVVLFRHCETQFELLGTICLLQNIS